MGVILPLKGQFNEQVHKIIVRMGPTLPLSPRLLRQVFFPTWSSKAEGCIYWPHTP